MQQFAADGPRRVLYYEVRMEGEHPSARKRGAEGWNTHRFRNRAIFSIAPPTPIKNTFPASPLQNPNSSLTYAATYLPRFP